jgi:hypothetical protein
VYLVLNYRPADFLHDIKAIGRKRSDQAGFPGTRTSCNDVEMLHDRLTHALNDGLA